MRLIDVYPYTNRKFCRNAGLYSANWIILKYFTFAIPSCYIAMKENYITFTMKPLRFYRPKFITPYVVLFLISGLFFGFAPTVQAQLVSAESYELRVAPDLWFNAVDGVQVGVRFRGEDPRTFLDGPHRLNGGFSIGTRFPDVPVSYDLSYVHPIDAISRRNSEGAFSLFSSVRAGLHHHETGFRKRWQPGFDEFVSLDLHVMGGFYRRFDNDYLLYESLWQDDPVYYLRTRIRKRDRNALGRWTLSLSAISGVPGGSGSDYVDFQGQPADRPEALGMEGLFGQIHLQALQQIEISSRFYVRSRLFAGTSSNALPGEHRYLASDAAAFDRIDSRLTRARGTVPQGWMESGWVHIPGGPGLRGFTFQTTEQLEQGLTAWIQHALAFNLDVYYPNPLNALLSGIPYMGDLLRLESYLFSDAGFLNEQSEWQDLKFNAGAGFMLSLNIPDYLGQDRGFFIRYDLPLWLSDASGEENFKIRHILGLGSVYRF